MPGAQARYAVTVQRVLLGPEDLAVQLPARGRVLRTVPGADRPDYSLAALQQPLRLRSTVQALSEAGVDVHGLDPRSSTVHDDGAVVALVYGLVLAPRVAGVVLVEAAVPRATSTTTATATATATDDGGTSPLAATTAVEVATALVLDPSQMADKSLHLEKVLYVAVTEVSVGHTAV